MNMFNDREKTLNDLRNKAQKVLLPNCNGMASISLDHTELYVENLSPFHLKKFIHQWGQQFFHFELKIASPLPAPPLIDVLNWMPNLSSLSLRLGGINSNDKLFNIAAKIRAFESLKLPFLKTLNIEGYRNLPSIYDFFAEFLPENSIAEHVLDCREVDPIGNENFLEKQKCIEKLEFKSRLYIEFRDIPWNQFDALHEFTAVCWMIEVPEVLTCFPNLKILTAATTLKLNSLAKFLPKIESLTLYYDRVAEELEFVEVDTGIVNESLKRLHVFNIFGNFWNFVGESSAEIPLIFPSLEVFKLMVKVLMRPKDIPESNLVAKNFLKDFIDWKNLKTLKVITIPLKPCEDYFEEIGDELKKISMKLEKASIRFKVNERENFSFEKLVEKNWKNFSVDQTDGLPAATFAL